MPPAGGRGLAQTKDNGYFNPPPFHGRGGVPSVNGRVKTQLATAQIGRDDLTRCRAHGIDVESGDDLELGSWNLFSMIRQVVDTQEVGLVTAREDIVGVRAPSAAAAGMPSAGFDAS